MTKIDKFLFWAPLPFIGMLYIFYRLLNPIKSPYSIWTHMLMGAIQGIATRIFLNLL